MGRRAALTLLLLITVCLTADARTPFGGGFAPVAVQPTVTSISGQDTTGGPFTITGTGFASKVSLWCDDGGGLIAHPLGFVPIVSTSATLVVANLGGAGGTQGPFTAGTYSCLLNNVGGGFAPAPGQLIIASTSAPNTIFSNVVAWWRDTDVTCGGGACTDGATNADSWTDKSGNGHALTAATGHKGTYHAQSTGTCAGGVPCFGYQPTISCDGSLTAFTASIPTSGVTNVAVWLVLRATGSSTFDPVELYGSTSITMVGTASATTGDSLQVNGGPNPGVMTTHQWPTVGSMWIVSGSTWSAAQNNSTPATLSTANTTQNWTLKLCSNDYGTFGAEVVEGLVVSDAYDATKWANVAQYFSLRYAISGPNPTQASPIPTTGGQVNIRGSNFIPGSTISVPALGISGSSLTLHNSTIANFTVPGGTYAPGTYSFDISNPDGTNGTGNNLLVITNTLSPTQISPSKVIAVYDPDATSLMTCVTAGCPNGTKIGYVVDSSFNGNDQQQATSANQYTLVTNDPQCNGHNSFAFDGAATFSATGSNLYGVSNPSAFGALVVAQESGASSGYAVHTGGSRAIGITWAGSGKPEMTEDGQVALWGTSTNGITASIFGGLPSGASPTLSINVGNGTAVTHSTTNANVNLTTTATRLGAYQGTSNFFNGHMCYAVLFNSSSLTGTEATNFETLAQSRGAF